MRGGVQLSLAMQHTSHDCNEWREARKEYRIGIRNDSDTLATGLSRKPEEVHESKHYNGRNTL